MPGLFYDIWHFHFLNEKAIDENTHPWEVRATIEVYAVVEVYESVIQPNGATDYRQVFLK